MSVLDAGGGALMDAEDVLAVARLAPWPRVVAVRATPSRRPRRRARPAQGLYKEHLTGRVSVPEDGAAVPVDPER